MHDGLSQNGGGGGSVAGDVVGLGGDFLHELGAHVLELVFEFDFLGDGHAVVGDGRAAEFLVEDGITTLRAEGGANGIGDDVDAVLERAASFFPVFELFGWHYQYLLV
ncbi:MAG: hypothetical protein BWY66_00101 [bacterium ADurb.Bin374]|nr:MAG: hypothetical protein BWY66_00101 [bacterium ADurb.Bin374]